MRIALDLEAGLDVDPGELAAQLWELGVAGVNIGDGRRDHLADPAEQAALLHLFTDAGADGLFVPGLADDRDIAEAVAAIELPLNVLVEPDGQRLADLGVRRISTGSLLFRAALGAAVTNAEAVRDGGPIPPVPSYQAIGELAQQSSAIPPARRRPPPKSARIASGHRL